MIEIIIKENEAGQRLDKYLAKILVKASSSFYYKMLRKKNITLNNKKADGKEKLVKGDCVKFFLSEETFAKFSKSDNDNYTSICIPTTFNVIYEDKDILLVNKPAGLLSQKAKITDTSLNEYVIAYLIKSGQLLEEDLATFKPSICNRLDRNTSGIVICGKTLKGLQQMNESIKNRSLQKFYVTLVKGALKSPIHLEGYLKKDEIVNKVSLQKEAEQGSVFISTVITPLTEIQLKNQTVTLTEVCLITGKTHQIRAHMASIGHPIIGDYKYGTRAYNDEIKKEFNISHQLLHAYKLVMPALPAPFEHLSGKQFKAKLPESFLKLLHMAHITSFDI